jgi:hypothetical protein
MKKSNSFTETISLTCVFINLGLFIFAVVSPNTNLQLLSLFNIACFLFYFLILGKSDV